MEDYKEIIKELILRHYSAEPTANPPILLNTLSILKMCQGVVPSQPITEHDIFEVMKEIGFGIEQKIHYEKICIFEGDEEEGIPPEYDEVETSREFLWKLYEK